MTVMQKKKDIAILHSMGYQSRDIVALFFAQGLVVGVIGTICGLIVGYVVCSYLATLPFSGGTMGSGSGLMMVSFNAKIYWQAGVLGILSSTIASILPARAAGKFTPIEIIRSGVE
jgi:lipoprotein-releasing system permease protein